jgi:hypothetical protein
LLAAALEELPALGMMRLRGAAPNAIAAPTRAAAAFSGVLVRPPTEIAAAGTAALVATKVTAPPGAATMAVEWLAPKGSAAATAVSTSRVFLLQLPGGRPRLRGTGGVAAGSLALLRLPSGRPRLRPLSPPAASALAPPKASSDDIEIEEAEMTVWCGEGVETFGSEENPRELRDLKASETQKAEPV